MTREEAIRHLYTYSTTMGSGQTSDEQHSEAKRMAIEALSERTGEWEEAEINGVGLPSPIFYVECSKCGWRQDTPTDFCPNCGADMRGKNNAT